MRYVFYGIYIFGLLLCNSALLRSLWIGVYRRISKKRRLSPFYDSAENAKKIPGNKLDIALEATGLYKIFPGKNYLLAASFLLGVGAFILVYWIEGAFMALLLGSVLFAAPILFLYMRLTSLRAENAGEGDVMVQELLSNYKICAFNMSEAIKRTAETMESCPGVKKLLFNLAKGLGRAYTEAAAEQVIDNFKYSIDTSWGNALGATIYFAHVQGVVVTDALEDLSETLSKSRQVVEYGLRQNSEAILMLKYLTPISYIASVACACKFFQFDFWSVLSYQFATAPGLKWFLLIIIFFACGLMMHSVFLREKMDI